MSRSQSHKSIASSRRFDRLVSKRKLSSWRAPSLDACGLENVSKRKTRWTEIQSFSAVPWTFYSLPTRAARERRTARFEYRTANWRSWILATTTLKRTWKPVIRVCQVTGRNKHNFVAAGYWFRVSLVWNVSVMKLVYIAFLCLELIPMFLKCTMLDCCNSIH